MNFKNIIIFSVIGILVVLLIAYFVSREEEPENLLYSSSDPLLASPATAPLTPSLSGDFLSLLLNIQNIKLDDAILSDPAFRNLRDSSIFLTPDGTEGRPNPFAPIGFDISATPANIAPVPPPTESSAPASSGGSSSSPSSSSTPPTSTQSPATTPPATPPPSTTPSPSGSGQIVL